MATRSQLGQSSHYFQGQPQQSSRGPWEQRAHALQAGDPRQQGQAQFSGHEPPAYFYTQDASFEPAMSHMPQSAPLGMRQAFAPAHPADAGASFMHPHRQWQSQPQQQAHFQPNMQEHAWMRAAQSAPNLGQRPTYDVSLGDVARTLQRTHSEMHDHMGYFARKGSLHLTRLGNVMSLLGAGGAAAAIVVGGASMATGIGIPVGALAAAVGVGILVAGLGLSALAGAGARSLARKTVNKDPQLRAKREALRALHTELAKIALPTDGEKTLLSDVEATLRATDSRFSLALKRHAKSAAKAPLYVLVGAVVCLPFIAAATGEYSIFSPSASFGWGSSGGGSSGGGSLDLSGRENQSVQMTPTMARLFNILEQPYRA